MVALSVKRLGRCMVPLTWGDVETVNVENFNSILRERVGRLVRRTKCFSKQKQRLWCDVMPFQFYWDFI